MWLVNKKNQHPQTIWSWYTIPLVKPQNEGSCNITQFNKFYLKNVSYIENNFLGVDIRQNQEFRGVLCLVTYLLPHCPTLTNFHFIICINFTNTFQSELFQYIGKISLDFGQLCLNYVQ